MKIELIKHIGEYCPVPPDSMVIYRTTSVTTPISHTHMPIMAMDLIWTKTPKIGRILEYRVVQMAKKKQ